PCCRGDGDLPAVRVEVVAPLPGARPRRAVRPLEPTIPLAPPSPTTDRGADLPGPAGPQGRPRPVGDQSGDPCGDDLPGPTPPRPGPPRPPRPPDRRTDPPLRTRPSRRAGPHR